MSSNESPHFLICSQECGVVDGSKYFGCCPKCGGNDGYLNVAQSHWQVCDKCKIKWPIGFGLFSSWKLETEEDWQRNEELLSTFTLADDWIAANISPSQRAMYEVRIQEWKDQNHV
jgi:hypothetical protein